MSFTEHSKKILEPQIIQTDKFLNEIEPIAKEYQESFKDRTEIGFNVFKMASTFYYRENFHSFILGSFLNPNEKHNEGNKYLHLFIDLLNKEGNQDEINKDDFRDSEVHIEDYKIDILITNNDEKSNDKNKAIIIENKVNNATDQYRQLPNYFNKIKESYDVVAIVYLTLHNTKSPDRTDWKKEECEAIDKILKIIPAYDVGQKSICLYEDWIKPSILLSQNLDNISILRQYGDLIKYLNTNDMDLIALDKFYNEIQKPDKLETALFIKTMLNDLPKYLAKRILKKYSKNSSPFPQVFPYPPSMVIFEYFIIGDRKFKMTIVCLEKKYEVYLTDKDVKKSELKLWSEQNIPALSLFNVRDNEPNTLKNEYSSAEEKDLFRFIDTLLDDLKKLSPNIN